jgi:hypothetical protein
MLPLDPYPSSNHFDLLFRLSIDHSQERNTGMQQKESRMSQNTEIHPEQQ